VLLDKKSNQSSTKTIKQQVFMNQSNITTYSPLEEKLNVYSHGFGILLSIIGLVLLVIKASFYGDVWQIVSCSIYGASMVVLYTASTCYHNATYGKLRKRLKIFDHASIYVLIGGTYTPLTLVSLRGVVGWVIFGLTWGFALVGIILKLFYTGKFKTVSTLMYVFMGWMIIFAIKPLVNNMEAGGLYLLIGGGVAYTIGAVLYSIKRIPYNHAIFHIFVLVGSICHYLCIYHYTI
jgi:hemolysin III